MIVCCLIYLGTVGLSDTSLLKVSGKIVQLIGIGRFQHEVRFMLDSQSKKVLKKILGLLFLGC